MSLRSAFSRFSLLAQCVAASASTLQVTNTNASGSGSLRQAMLSALAGDTITFAPGVTGTIAVATPLPAITSDLTIMGPGAGSLTIDGGGFWVGSPVFWIKGGTVNLSGLAITNGYSGRSGGGVEVDAGTVTLANCVLARNIAYDNGGGLYVGGLANVTVRNCLFQGNQAAGGCDQQFQRYVDAKHDRFDDDDELPGGHRFPGVQPVR